MQSQIDLFVKSVVKVPCTQCGREIVLSRRTKGGTYSERQNKAGLCWGCELNKQVEESKRQ